MKLLIGLGNHGRKFKHTRHNVGEEFLVGWLYEKNFKKLVEKKRLKSYVSVGNISDYFSESGRDLPPQNVVVAFPTAFMNTSGEAVQKLAAFYGTDPEDILVVHDDIDLPIGKLRLRIGSRSGGHNGVESIIDRLGTSHFYRLKIGVNPTDGDLKNVRLADASKFVLGKFTKEEKEVLKEIFPKAVEMIDTFVSKNPSFTATQRKTPYGTRPKTA